MNEISVILLAAGMGERFGSILPKQFANIADETHHKTVWRCAYDYLRFALPYAKIVITGSSAHQHLWDIGLADLSPLDENFIWVEGGATRSESVKAGLAELRHNTPKYVLIHDCARAFVPKSTIDNLIIAMQGGAVAAIPAIPAVDTIKLVTQMQVSQTLERDKLWQVQTPQAFRYDMLVALHQNNNASMTDDATLFEQAGEMVQVIQGDAISFKITNASDLELAKFYYGKIYSGGICSGEFFNAGMFPEMFHSKMFNEQMFHSKMFHGQMFQSGENVSHETISAMGYDVHRLIDIDNAAPQYIRLGGVDIPHHQCLNGHSDADVVLHAITDALLGLVGAGDIGKHFPPSNAQFKGFDSAIFLRHAMQILLASGGKLLHIDVTIIAESPKISPYREAIRARIAAILEIELRRVSVKATTTEGLGFAGRNEGIAAQAIASAKIIR